MKAAADTTLSVSAALVRSRLHWDAGAADAHFWRRKWPRRAAASGLSAVTAATDNISLDPSITSHRKPERNDAHSPYSQSEVLAGQQVVASAGPCNNGSVEHGTNSADALKSIAASTSGMVLTGRI